jgi:hypothetical protein
LALEVAIAAVKEAGSRGSDEPLLHGDREEEGDGHVRLQSERGCEPRGRTTKRWTEYVRGCPVSSGKGRRSDVY